jgi:uncharacterized membrane protein YfcA
MRAANLIGLTIGGLIGYLCSFDIDTSLGAAKVPVYIAIVAIFGWLASFSFSRRRPDDPPLVGRNAELAAAVRRAETAEIEVERLRARVAELERGDRALNA